MAKTIKFNLICDGTPVRTVEDLQNNFSIEDVLSYYESGLLLRWLNVRSYTAEAEKVSVISAKDPMGIIKDLLKIFDVTQDEKKIEEGIYMLKYLKEREELCDCYQKENYQVQRIIDDYAAGYRQLVNGMIDNPNDIAIIKANINEIVTNYGWILDLNYRKLFYDLVNVSPLAIMCLLMNEKSRYYYLPVIKEMEDGTKESDINVNSDKAELYQRICNMVDSSTFLFDMSACGNLHTFSGATDRYWKEIASRGKRYMIISIGFNDYVRSAGELSEQFGRADVLHNFLILDGIDYESNSDNNSLVYMEV